MKMEVGRAGILRLIAQKRFYGGIGSFEVFDLVKRSGADDNPVFSNWSRINIELMEAYGSTYKREH